MRQCGKTTLLQVLPEGWKHYDLEGRADLQLVSHDPDLFSRLNPRQVAIDEAQVFPDLSPALRVAIDQHRAERGRFVITGSTSPTLLNEALQYHLQLCVFTNHSVISTARLEPGACLKPSKNCKEIRRKFRSSPLK